MTLKTDRPVYYPGDRARITLATPAAGFLLSAVEKGDRLLSSSWRRIEGNEPTVELPVTRDLIPNAYLSVSLFQPHGTGSNDRPLRMYGIAPIKVEDPLTRETLTLQDFEVLRPNKTFTVAWRTASGTPTQFHRRESWTRGSSTSPDSRRRTVEELSTRKQRLALSHVRSLFPGPSAPTKDDVFPKLRRSSAPRGGEEPRGEGNSAGRRRTPA
jgi:hypothetical protein